MFGGGALAGWTAHRSSALETEMRGLTREVASLAQDPAPRPAAGSCVAVVDSKLVADEIKRALADGAGSAVDPAAGKAVAQTPAEPPPSTPEVLETMKHGEELVAQARGTGHWTTENALAFKEVMSNLDDQTRMQLRLEVIQAINKQELKVDSPLMF